MSMTKYDRAGDLKLQLEIAEGRSNKAQILIIKHPFATNDCLGQERHLTAL
jgi:hypothetical protein